MHIGVLQQRFQRIGNSWSYCTEDAMDRVSFSPVFYVLDSPLLQPLSRSSLVFLLVLDPLLHTSCISSPSHHLLAFKVSKQVKMCQNFICILLLSVYSNTNQSFLAIKLLQMLVHCVPKRHQTHGRKCVNSQQIFKIFHYQILQKIWSKVLIKDPTTPHMHRYTTLWNINVRKWTTVAN